MDVVVATPVGYVRLAADGERLVAVEFGAAKPARRVRAAGVLAEAEAQLRAYFARSLERFNLPLALDGTPFQMRVWRALQTIPYGETRSYLEMARLIGRPDAVRAVGAANGQNPIPIVIPCHRVIGSNGTLVGFGGGLDAKRFLLDLERPQLALGLSD
jgi:methylated-DNA-[protein]-cysteine S-methyltransferase